MNKFAGYPYIYGEWNNFKPQRMYTVEELCYMLDKEKTDVIEFLKKFNLVNQMVQKPEDMNEKELGFYNSKLMESMKRYKIMKKWRQILAQALRYEKPFLANPEALLVANPNEDIKLLDELYPDYMEATDSEDTETE